MNQIKEENLSRKPSKDYYEKIYSMEAWQGLHVAQLGSLRSLIIGLSTAAMGFNVTLLIEDTLSCKQIAEIKLSIVLLFVSIFAGIYMAFLESENYRLKYEIGRKLERHKEDKEPVDISTDEAKCTNIEHTTGVLIYIEIVFFLLAVAIEAFGFLFN